VTQQEAAVSAHDHKHAEDDVSAIEQEAEEQSVTDATRLSARLIYEVIRRDGEEELARPTQSLIWSGSAAGILISFSVIGEAIFRAHLPESTWRFLLENLGYSLGFLLVIMGRMQLFTENTITTVLPLMSRFCWECIRGTLRLWGIVLAANIVGAFVAAGFILWTPAFQPEVVEAIDALSHHALDMGFFEAIFRAMPAGVLIAALVWMMPSVPASDIMMVVIFTWLIAAGDFAHVVAGSVEMAFLILSGQINLFAGFGGFFIPVLLGNIIGGTAVFTMMAWAQVANELRHRRRRRHTHAELQREQAGTTS
jgi:formate/nitrite transporter FocA (FNT family)